MPRNPKAEARRKLEEAERNFRAGRRALDALVMARKVAMTRAVAAGYTTVEVGRICNVTRGHVSNVCTEAKLARVHDEQQQSA